MLPRGLKCIRLPLYLLLSGRGLCCLVDWNTASILPSKKYLCRGLCCLVDWNADDEHYQLGDWVEAYVASWIEMLQLPGNQCGTVSRLMLPRGLKFVTADLKGEKKMSRLMLPRGLKYPPGFAAVFYHRRGLCCLVDWNIFHLLLPWPYCVEAYVASWIEIVG